MPPPHSCPKPRLTILNTKPWYEVVVRLRAGKPLPFPLMTTVCAQDELLRLVRAAEKRGVRLSVTTDERIPGQPENVEALLALLPEKARKVRGPKPH